ncbi:MAG: RimK family alpha-L-glutamate ligase [Cellulosilyticaceae bacterium]
MQSNNDFNMKAWLVVNGWLRSEKFEELTNMYKESAKKFKIKLIVKYTDEILYGIAKDSFVTGLEDEKPEFVLFLDKDTKLAQQLENKGLRLFNNSEVIRCCDDKSLTFLKLQNQNIPMPTTIIAPLVFEGTKDGNEKLFMDQVEKVLQYPFIIKECFGSFGQQVYKIDNRLELEIKRNELKYIPHIYQEMIQTSYGKDIRVQVVGGQVVAAMIRRSKGDFRANVTAGATMENTECPKSFEELALKVCEKLEIDFAGVDLLFGPENKPVLCEVNSNAHIKNILDCTGVNVADKIIEWIKKEMSNK